MLDIGAKSSAPHSSGAGSADNSAPTKTWSGFIQKARMAPSNSIPMLPIKGNSQFPVLSIMNPNTRGEMMAAKAVPVFIRPLAEPEYLGAISMGIAHKGPTVNSEKKNARLRQIAAPVKLWENSRGIMQAREHRNPITIRLRRALSRLPVRESIAIANHTTQCVAHNAGKKYARREKCRVLQL